MTRRIQWNSRAQKDFDALDRVVSQRIESAIERFAGGDGDVRRLTGVDPPLFRLRAGDWRILFRFDAETIVILRILPRDKAYR
jgi:mRNA-degrading endonuclease RelE of RelBE toxin-antitoxin system